jgi:hypothetical protein
VLYGALLGLFAQALSDLAERGFGPEAVGVAPVPQQRKRIVILGGGFAGMKTAECLEQELRMNSSAMITLITQTNALLCRRRVLILFDILNLLGIATIGTIPLFFFTGAEDDRSAF